MGKKILPISKVKTLMSQITTIHGIKQLAEVRNKSWAVWLLITVSNALLTAAFVVVIKDHYNNDRIVTRVDVNCKVNMVPFPAVSICNFNMISVKESQNIAAILKKHNRSELQAERLLRSLPRLLHLRAGPPAREMGDLQAAMAVLTRQYYQIDSVMEEVHQKCGSLLVRCAFNRRPLACGDVFRLIKTYEGFCCAFNYAALNDGSEDSILYKHQNNEFEYYEDAESFEITNIITTSEFGRKSGLSVVLNMEPRDYPPWWPPFYGAKVLISDPNDYPETTVTTRLITLGESLHLGIKPIIIQTDPDIRHVDPDKRLCWFHDEVFLGHTDRYSYETCKTECKMNGYREICGCLPYKYPREKSTRLCEFSDLACLRNVTVHESHIPCDPTCYAECGDKRYAMTTSTVPFLAEDFPDLVKKNLNASVLSAVQVFFNKATCNCYRMSLLMDTNYMIATYGGVFSLSFGASLITAFEIVHLISTFAVNIIRNRLTQYMFNHHKQYFLN